MNENQQIEQNNSSNAAVELGRKLRQAREAKGFSVGEVAERLKLPARQIEGLESGNYEGLPELVFVRGFLRTYGRFLELDDSEVANALDQIMPQNRSNVYAVDRSKNAADLNYQQTKPKKGLPTWILGVLAAAAIVGGIYAWQSKSQAENEKADSNSETHIGLGEVAAPAVGASNVEVVAMASDDSIASASAPAHAAASGVQIAASAPAEAAANVATVAANELVVKVRYRSNLVIKDKAGQFVINKIVPAGSEHRFQGGAPYNVWIGYALGATANYGGQDIVVSKHMIGKKTSSFTAGN